MPCTQKIPFQKNMLAIAAGALLTPLTGWTLELVQEPPLPTSKSAFVAPNVIISVDDSGSMEFGVKTSTYGSSKTGKGYTQPDDSGNWKDEAQRINVLKYALKEVFNNKTLIPENKIRISWQAMHNNGGSSGAGNVDSSTMKTNSMRPIDATVGTGTHRTNFLSFVDKLTPKNGTPSHLMFSQADAYMRRALSSSSPWSTDPGGTGSKSTEYLGCRRNYHIMMTDGRWNGAVSGGNQEGNNWAALNGRKAYSKTSDQTKVYYDNNSDNLSDWAFKSWMEPLQDPTKLKDSDKLKPSKVYEEAPATELFELTKNVNIYETRPVYENQCVAWDWRGRCTKTQKVQVGTEEVVVGTKPEKKSVNLEKYWNPKYNPATWPHMVTYTIGFSSEAVTWPGASDIIAPSTKVPFGYDNSFVDLVTGWQTWPAMDSEDKRSLDLWHASINGRGRYYAVTEAQDLAKAFTEIIGVIDKESAPLPDEIAGGGSTSGYNVSQSNAGIFASIYSPKRAWSGSITATRAIEPEEYACPTKADPNLKCIRFPDTIAGWEGKSTADRLDALANVDSRLILSWSDASSGGIPFKWDATSGIGYSNAQKLALLGVTSGDTSTDPLKTQAKNIVDYIRGVRDLEGTTPEKPLRVRYSRQGDIVNSEIWYTGNPSGNYAMGYSKFVKDQKDRTPVLYVGGNDGMLHGFSAKDGKELIAYVPRGVVSGLKDLTDKDYVHRYYVDGSPMTGDVLDGTTWKTLLVGTLGAGGKGYFVLDVTNPGSFSSAAPSSLVVMDRTRSNTETASGSEADIGNIVAQPGRNPSNMQEATQITRLNSKNAKGEADANGRWAVVMGNGYNSTNQRPVLLVQYLDGNKELVTIPTTDDAAGSGYANDNGLASPALVDLDGDGKTDVVYAGDNQGNLWKFDLTSIDNTKWKVAFDKKPLFTTRGLASATASSRNAVQPITAPPIVRANDRMKTVGTGKDAKTVPVGGMMVAFGTGRNLTANDRKTDITQPVQTLYSVLDNTRYCLREDKTSLQAYESGTKCASTVDADTPVSKEVGTMTSDGKLLAKQEIVTVSGDFATVKATQELNKETWSTYKGWYLDLPFSGERLLKPMQFFDGSNILAVYTESPAGTKNSESDNINESCVPVKVDTSAGSQFRTLINIMDGKIPTVQLVDYDGNGQYNSADQKVARAAVKTGTPVLITQRDRIVDKTGGGGGRDTLNRMPEQSLRPSWRQLK